LAACAVGSLGTPPDRHAPQGAPRPRMPQVLGRVVGHQAGVPPLPERHHHVRHPLPARHVPQDPRLCAGVGAELPDDAVPQLLPADGAALARHHKARRPRTKAMHRCSLRACARRQVITRGSDQVAISSRYEVRNDPAVVRNFGNILIEFAKVVPDGLACFFPSYVYMEDIIAAWERMVGRPATQNGRARGSDLMPTISITATLLLNRRASSRRCSSTSWSLSRRPTRPRRASPWKTTGWCASALGLPT